MRDDGAICLSGPCSDRSGEEYYVVKLLYQLGVPGPQFREEPQTFLRKIGEVYVTASKFDILFSDYSKGDPELFVRQFLNPRGAWFSVEKQSTGEEVGVLYLTELNPYWDAFAHISFWDSILPGREPVIWDTAQWVMETYALPRLSAEVPTYQKHFNRFVRKLGFREEGLKRQAGLREGKRVDHYLYGMLANELKEVRNGKQH